MDAADKPRHVELSGGIKKNLRSIGRSNRGKSTYTSNYILHNPAYCAYNTALLCYVIYFGVLMDTLSIKNLTVNTRIGVHDWEQQILQRLVIDISIPIDSTVCHDELANTIDYDKLCQLATTYLEGNAFRLIETVANKLAELIKDEFKVPQLTISVSKPYAIKNAGDIRITVTR
ncbi:dihydroneopterin aldolase [Legionella lansingensis]|uniref:7,8-dihydroneopterin aldolase n=3 Tax=Legionella lansingensis TaxID=45067 RepID=A0A0W0VU28_9GAMM|nr:dihydroneopterin aldolase [Legionella lansingensis]SNV47428.1 dihydroneopterin aldolase [Legionella lansingensis]